MYQQPCANLPMPKLLLLYDQMIFKALRRLLIEFDFPRDDVVQKYRNGETDRGASLGVQLEGPGAVVRAGAGLDHGDDQCPGRGAP